MLPWPQATPLPSADAPPSVDSALAAFAALAGPGNAPRLQALLARIARLSQGGAEKEQSSAEGGIADELVQQGPYGTLSVVLEPMPDKDLRRVGS